MRRHWEGVQHTSNLAHEVVDDTVEAGALEVQGLARSAHALLASAQAAEVLRSLGHDISAQGHLNAAQGLPAGSDIKENNRVRHVFWRCAVDHSSHQWPPPRRRWSVKSRLLEIQV